jgi:hypothetical protein
MCGRCVGILEGRWTVENYSSCFNRNCDCHFLCWGHEGIAILLLTFVLVFFPGGIPPAPIPGSVRSNLVLLHLCNYEISRFMQLHVQSQL